MRSLITTIVLLLLGFSGYGQVTVRNQVLNNVNITKEIACTGPIYTEAEFKAAVGVLIRKMQFYSEDDAAEYMAYIRTLGAKGWYENRDPNDRLLVLIEDTNWWFHQKYWDYGR